MDDAELERIIRAIQMPLGGSALPGGRRVSRVPANARTAMCGQNRSEAGKAERCGTNGRATSGRATNGRATTGRAKRRKPETEVRRLQKAIRTSFHNSPHKKKYWMALLEMYGKPEWRREAGG